MNPDIVQPIPVPDALQPFFRRALIARKDLSEEMKVLVRGTGYCYLSWIQSGRWRAAVDGALVFDSDKDGRVLLTGQVFDGDVQVWFAGNYCHIFTEFTAVGQYAFLGVSGQKTYQKAVNPCQLVPSLGPSLTELESLTAHNLTPENIARIFFDCLAHHTPVHTVPDHVALLVSEIEATNGNITLKDLVEESDVSERKSRDDFTRIVGLTPKRFARLFQINAALGALLDLGETRLADLAAEHGFSDQAHMTRSFGDFLGKSPVKFVEDIEPTLREFVGFSRRDS